MATEQQSSALDAATETIQGFTAAQRAAGFVTVDRARLWELIDDYASADVADDVFDVLGLDPISPHRAAQRQARTMVLVDRARFERLLAVAEAAHEWANAPYSHNVEGGGELWATAESGLSRLTDALKPGDIDPLP